MSSVIKSMLGSLSALALSACAPVNVLNALVPDNNYVRTVDIVYGDLKRQMLDIYQPHMLTQASSPTVVFFYGGGWKAGDKKDYKFVAEALTSKGMTVVIADYRLYPEVVFPNFVEDAATAVDWTYRNIDQYGGNPNQLFVAGHSAGAHIAALLSLDPIYLEKHALTPSIINGMIGLAGPYDFLPLKSETLKSIFGEQSEQWRSQPINFVTGGQPPMMLMVGDNDLTVLPRNSINLAERIREKGGQVQLERFEGYGHVAMVAKLAKPLRGNGALLKPIIRFINENSR